jgi:DNA-binding XRE family transcriptional regulator
MLYFFHGRIAAVLTHGLVKESEVPQRDIELAIRRKLNFERDPDRHVRGVAVMAKAKRKATTDAVEILHRRYYAGKPQRLAALDQARANGHVARMLTALRIANGLSQRQLAQLIGTTASVICRLEDVNYEGHSLAMLNRIAAALNQRVEIRFVSVERRLRSA